MFQPSPQSAKADDLPVISRHERLVRSETCPSTPSERRMSLQGRVEPDAYRDSLPKTGHWKFRFRNQPFVTEYWRPQETFTVLVPLRQVSEWSGRAVRIMTENSSAKADAIQLSGNVGNSMSCCPYGRRNFEGR